SGLGFHLEHRRCEKFAYLWPSPPRFGTKGTCLPHAFFISGKPMNTHRPYSAFPRTRRASNQDADPGRSSTESSMDASGRIGYIARRGKANYTYATWVDLLNLWPSDLFQTVYPFPFARAHISCCR